MVVVIDPQIAGVSGDMLLSALVDLGADRQRIIDGVSDSGRLLGSEIRRIEFQKTIRHGVQAVGMILDVDGDSPGRSASEIRQAVAVIAETVGLSRKARDLARSSIDRLIHAESRIHGTRPGETHLHEASGVDTVVDIVGTCIAIDDLNMLDEQIVCMPVCVGSGTVSFSHGTMSNPAGAILEILRDSGLTIRGSPVDAELVTPTGASILASMTCTSRTHYPAMKISSVGYGAGAGDHAEFANVLKIVRGESHAARTDYVKVVETNVDDVTGEILGSIIDRIMERGARDISIHPGTTKKGRPTSLISVICDDNTVDGIIDTLIEETGTLGIRITDSERVVVPRDMRSCSIQIGDETFDVRYKRSAYKGRIDFKIEFDDIMVVSRAIGRSARATEFILRREIERLESS